VGVSEDKDRRRNLLVPETATIAQLLAEIMPKGQSKPEALIETVSAPAQPLIGPSGEPESNGAESVISSTLAQPLELPIAVSQQSVYVPPIDSFPSPIAEVVVAPAPMGGAPLVLTDQSAGLFLQHFNWDNEPVIAPATEQAADTDLIPLGELTVSEYFSLVNWSNEAGSERIPRWSEFGLDEASLTLARTIPFYVTGQARSPDRFSVSAVMAQFDWKD
jgi:hypothetical protein